MQNILWTSDLSVAEKSRISLLVTPELEECAM